MAQPSSSDPPPAASDQNDSSDLSALVDSRWQRDVLRPLLIIAITSSMLLGPIALARLVGGENRVYALFPFFILVAVQAVYTRLWLANPRHRWYRDFRTQLGEILALLVILRLVVWYIQRQTFSMAVLEQWFLDPLTFFDLLFLVTALLMFFAWKYAGSVTMVFVDLGLSPDEMVDYRKAGLERDWVQARPKNRQELLEQFGEIWIWGGVILVFTAALSRVQFQPEPGRLIGLRTLGLGPDLVLALLIYFLGGLLLLSQGRLALLRARWQYEGTPGIAQVTKTWHRYALLTILGVALLASLLPFGSTFGLAFILSAIIRAVWLVVAAMITLIPILLALFLSLFGVAMPETPPSPPSEAAPPPSPPPPPPSTIPPWASGTLFWVLAVAIVVYLIALFLRRRKISLPVITAWWARLLDWWRSVRGQARDVMVRARQRLRSTEILTNLPAPTIPWRYIRLRGLSPTERIRYYYLSTLKRAAALGLGRAASQTPLEYEATLTEHWSDMDDDVHALTQSFILARYSPRPAGETEERRARRAWEELKRALRVRRRKQTQEIQPEPAPEEQE